MAINVFINKTIGAGELPADPIYSKRIIPATLNKVAFLVEYFKLRIGIYITHSVPVRSKGLAVVHVSRIVKKSVMTC